MHRSIDRRGFLRQSLTAAGAGLLAGPATQPLMGRAFAEAEAAAAGGRKKRPGEPEGLPLGLVTYQWGKDMDLPTLLATCEAAGVLGVELRTGHKHGVEPELIAQERVEVRKRFADSPVSFVGPGSDERFDNPDPAVLARAIQRTREYLQLSHDTGGSGVKVKPDRFHPNVPRERTIEQIGRSLDECGRFAADLGQEVRLEVHGHCSELTTIRAIMQIADHPAVGVCWNCNAEDLEGEGLDHNFRLVRDRFAATVHIHEFDSDRHVYPYGRLVELMVATGYDGWLLLEGISPPTDDRMVAGLKRQRELFAESVRQARQAAAAKQ